MQKKKIHHYKKQQIPFSAKLKPRWFKRRAPHCQMSTNKVFELEHDVSIVRIGPQPRRMCNCLFEPCKYFSFHLALVRNWSEPSKWLFERKTSYFSGSLSASAKPLLVSGSFQDLQSDTFPLPSFDLFQIEAFWSIKTIYLSLLNSWLTVGRKVHKHPSIEVTSQTSCETNPISYELNKF